MGTPLRFIRYDELGGAPNVIVDGAPTEGTVLTLTHWPGHPAPAGLAADLSAQMAFSYLDAGAGSHGGAAAASNNHFDQDGLVGLLALVDPDRADPDATTIDPDTLVQLLLAHLREAPADWDPFSPKR